MLTLKFQVPAPNDILLTVVIESHTPQREAKILWCPSGGKKTKQIPYSLHLFVMFVLDKPPKCPKFIYIHTHVCSHSGRNAAAETQMHPPKHILLF